MLVPPIVQKLIRVTKFVLRASAAPCKRARASADGRGRRRGLSPLPPTPGKLLSYDVSEPRLLSPWLDVSTMEAMVCLFMSDDLATPVGSVGYPAPRALQNFPDRSDFF